MIEYKLQDELDCFHQELPGYGVYHSNKKTNSDNTCLVTAYWDVKERSTSCVEKVLHAQNPNPLRPVMLRNSDLYLALQGIPTEVL